MRLRRCPHRDCSGSPGYLDHYLVTPETPDGLLCRACRRSPTSTDVVFPPDYLMAWEGPGAVLGSIPHVDPVVFADLLTTRQAAELMGCSQPLVATLLRAARRVGRYTLYHVDEVEQVRRTMRPMPPAGPTRTYTLEETAALLGVSPDRVRDLIAAHGVTAFRAPGDGRRRLLDATGLATLSASLTPADRTDVELLGITAAAARVGITPSRLREAVQRGEISALRATGGRYRFTPDDLDAYARTLGTRR
ncbi:MAG TPA: helix-turn-helix domain-containing protein [Acidimicrobiales bacterium]|nr:helix-turn-helix domain-containing protein [Acidimicrobiales bacterium]